MLKGSLGNWGRGVVLSLLWFLSRREEEGRPQEKLRKTGECLPGPQGCGRLGGSTAAPWGLSSAHSEPATPRQVPTHLGSSPPKQETLSCRIPQLLSAPVCTLLLNFHGKATSLVISSSSQGCHGTFPGVGEPFLGPSLD